MARNKKVTYKDHPMLEPDIKPEWDDEWWLLGVCRSDEMTSWCVKDDQVPVAFIGPFQEKDWAREDRITNELASTQDEYIFMLAQVGIWRKSLRVK